MGNGFDLNLGLDTLYSDFVKDYKKSESDNEVLKRFKKHIEENEPLWSNAELELGQYTKEFEKGEAQQLSICHNDFCKNLVVYLRNQENRIDFEKFSSEIVLAFSNLEQLTNGFHSQEKNSINVAFSNHRDENIAFRFINFNYTSTLDKCIKIITKSHDVLKSHIYKSTRYAHTITENVHVHGTLDKELVFAVNDESQIANLDVFDCEFGDIYKNSFIKKNANDSYGENTDIKVLNLINNSTIIYVYGMSVGDTDRIWWSRICDWLSHSPERQLIIHKFQMPPKGLLQVEYKIEEEKYKKFILSKSNLAEDRYFSVMSQIHITDYNIFSNINRIANHDILEEVVNTERLLAVK